MRLHTLLFFIVYGYLILNVAARGGSRGGGGSRSSGGSRGGSRSSGGSHSSWGGSHSSWGGSGSSGSSNSWGGSHTNYKPSAPVLHPSTNHLSGSSISSGTNVHSYPKSNGGLSGTGSSSHLYPSSNGGLSGTGSSSHLYPSSNGGLSSSGTGHLYPASNGGLSGTGTGHLYPASTGLSGSSYPKQPASNPSYPSYSNANSGYPKNTGSVPLYPVHTGSNPSYPTNGGTHYSNSFPTNTGTFHSPATHTTVYQTHYVPPPVYIQQISNSGASHSNLLTGLWLYNLGRSNNHHHYYHNSNTYTQSQNSNNQIQSRNSVQSAPVSDLSNCALLITDKNTNKTERLEIPCELVNSFAPLRDNTTINNTTATNNTISLNIMYPTVNITTPTPTLLGSASPNKSESLNISTPIHLDAFSNVVNPSTTNATLTSVIPLVASNLGNNTVIISDSTARIPSASVPNSSTINTNLATTPLPSIAARNSSDANTITPNKVSDLICVVEVYIKRVKKTTPVDCGLLAKLAVETSITPPPPSTNSPTTKKPTSNFLKFPPFWYFLPFLG